MYTIRVITATCDVKVTTTRKPKAWKSWIMQRCPYGTDFYGAQFSITKGS